MIEQLRIVCVYVMSVLWEPVYYLVDLSAVGQTKLATRERDRERGGEGGGVYIYVKIYATFEYLIMWGELAVAIILTHRGPKLTLVLITIYTRIIRYFLLSLHRKQQLTQLLLFTRSAATFGVLLLPTAAVPEQFVPTGCCASVCCEKGRVILVQPP